MNYKKAPAPIKIAANIGYLKGFLDNLRSLEDERMGIRAYMPGDDYYEVSTSRLIAMIEDEIRELIEKYKIYEN